MKQLLQAVTPNRTVSRSTTTLLVAVSIAALFGMWLLSPYKAIPGPFEVLKAWGGLLRDGLPNELYVSLTTNLQAIGISLVFTLIFSYLSVLPVLRPFVSFLSKSRFFGMTGFVVIFTLMFGAGHGLKIALLVFGMSVFFLTSMAEIVASIPKEELDHARTLRMGDWRVVWEIVILGRADYALEALRQNAAISWMMLSMVEGYSRGEGGVGAMMLNENKHFNLAAVFALQLTILLVGIGQDWLLGWLKRTLCPYSEITVNR